MPQSKFELFSHVSARYFLTNTFCEMCIISKVFMFGVLQYVCVGQKPEKEESCECSQLSGRAGSPAGDHDTLWLTLTRGDNPQQIHKQSNKQTIAQYNEECILKTNDMTQMCPTL